ncbi:MAG TPA: hypothetical protein VF318_02215 [Dehalococcoidales bacterium]
MFRNKYGRYVKPIPFQDYGPGSFRQGAKLDSRFFGLDVDIQFGTFWAAGKISEGIDGTHTHDFNQVILWMGSDLNDMGSLNAEIEFCLGEEKEKHIATTSSAIFLPQGFPHFPATITRMDRRFIMVTVSCAPEWHATPVLMNKPESEQIAGWGAKYRNRVINASFQRKGAWHYGPMNRDDSGGYLTFLRNPNADFEFLLLYESLKKAPYRFDPDPTQPHTHPQPEILFFLGTDTDDLSELGGEVEVSLGEEMEKHIINRPTAIVVPAGLPHNPLTITKVRRPFILMDVRPFGHGGTGGNPKP